jgi:uncharacterized protein
MEILIISIAAFIVAILTFFSGFGLGTILTPVFMLFFPVELAIALTGVVHFFNNVFGAYFGNKLLKKVTLRCIQITVAVLLILMSLALGAGVI